MTEKQYQIVQNSQQEKREYLPQRNKSIFIDQFQRKSQQCQHNDPLTLIISLKKKYYIKCCLILFIILLFVYEVVIFLSQKEKYLKYQLLNRDYMGQQFGKFKSTMLQFNLSMDQQLQMNAYNSEDNSLFLNINFIQQIFQQIENKKQIQQKLQERIAYQSFILYLGQNQQKSIQVSQNKNQLNPHQLCKNCNYLRKNSKSFMQNLVQNEINNKINISSLFQSNNDQWLEYLYADKKYSIGKQTKQSSICIFTQGLNVKKQKVIKYFDSISKLNYSNFHIVYVNEFQTDLHPQNILKYLKQSQIRLNNKIRLVNNLQYLGTLGNIYFWVKRFCKQEDIVFIVGKDEAIIGRQTLKVLNAFYKQKNFQYIFSDFLSLDNFQLRSQFLKSGSHVRSFRKKMLDSIRLESLIQYKFDKIKRVAWPSLYRCQLSECHQYLGFNTIQNQNFGYLSQFLLLIRQNTQVCQNNRKEFHFQLLTFRNEINNRKMPQSIKNYTLIQKKIQNIKNASLNLVNCKLQGLKKRFYKITFYNLNYIHTLFGKSDQVMINLTKYSNQTRNVWKSIRSEETKSANDTIYVLTPTDTNKLIKKINFWEYKQQLLNQIPYEVLEFQFNPKFNTSLPNLKFKYFHNDSQIQQYLSNLFNKSENIEKLKDTSFQIGTQIFFNPTSQQALQAQLYYYNKKYNISQKQKESSICIFTAQKNIYKKNQYKQYFDSIQRLNYSNYRVVFVDDMSSDQSAYKLYDLINNGGYNRIKNRMIIIHNFQSLKAQGNMYIWTQKLCKQNDIVINLDADDAILGTQTLKILSSIYEDQKIWYAYSKFLFFDPRKNSIRSGFSSKDLNYKTSNYRRARDYKTSHLRTYRLKLMKQLPIYQFLHFHYNSNTNIAWPAFQSLAHDTANVFSHFQLAGNDRVKFIKDYLYSYYGAFGSNKCYRMHQNYDYLRDTVKTPLQQLKSLQQKGEQIIQQNINEQLYKSPNQVSNLIIKQKCFQN